MSVRRLADEQPASFEFTSENVRWAEGQIAKYPEGRQASAVIPLLWQAQKQNDYWLPQKAIEKVADMLEMPYIRVLEVATFYTMFNLAPVGRYFIQMCGTTPCMLRGSDDIKAVLERRVGAQREISADGNFAWLEVECLGACCNAPMVQINDDYYEDLSAENFEKLLDDLAAGRPVNKGSQTGRKTSEPAGGLTSLTSLYGVDGRSGPGVAGEGQSASDHSAAAGEKAHQDQRPGEPASERLAQEEAESSGKPEHPAVTSSSDPSKTS
jgi:NADH-quinone oxidoreductase subunit E